MVRQPLFWNAKAEVVSHCVRMQPPLRRPRCAARQLHTLSRRPVSVCQKKRRRRKPSLAVGLRAQSVCGGGNGCQGEWGRQQMNRREATRRWEAQKRWQVCVAVPPPTHSYPTLTTSRTPLSCQRWDTGRLGLLAGVRACACLYVFVLLWGMWLDFLDGSCASSPLSHGTMSCQWRPPPLISPPPFMFPPPLIEVNISEVALGFGKGYISEDARHV